MSALREQSQHCHLSKMDRRELVVAGEEEKECGGYFICNGACHAGDVIHAWRQATHCVTECDSHKPVRAQGWRS
jgi:hypothetical protein